MFRDNFVHLLERKGVSSYRLSIETGIAQSCLSDYKAGRTEPTAKNLKKIADYFDISVSDLLEGPPKDPSPFTLTPEEIRLIKAYRTVSAERKESICLLLGVKPEEIVNEQNE